MTYIPTWSAGCIGDGDGRVLAQDVGWAMDTTCARSCILEALQMALTQRQPRGSSPFDRGSQSRFNWSSKQSSVQILISNKHLSQCSLTRNASEVGFRSGVRHGLTRRRRVSLRDQLGFAQTQCLSRFCCSEQQQTASSSRFEYLLRSVPFGKYCRKKALVFHWCRAAKGCGSQK